MTILLCDGAEYPRLVFIHELDNGYGIAPQGYRSDVTLELQKGVAFPVAFYEAAAVCEELQARSKHGFGAFVAEPGLVIVPKITAENMKTVAKELVETGYFKQLLPMQEEAANKTVNPSGGSGVF